MMRSQADSLVAMLQAYFPRPELPDSTIAAWASEFLNHDFDDATEAIRRVAREKSYPVLADALAFIEDERRTRVMREDPEPPRLTPAEVMEQMPPAVREHVVAMIEGSDIDFDRQHEAEDREWERTKERTLAGLRMHAVCSGAGQEPILVDGKRVCPSCKVEVPDLIVRIPKVQRSPSTRWRRREREEVSTQNLNRARPAQAGNPIGGATSNEFSSTA